LDGLTVKAGAHREMLAYQHAHQDEIWVALSSEVMAYVTGAARRVSP